MEKLTEREQKVLESFAVLLPKMTETDLKILEAFGQGMAVTLASSERFNLECAVMNYLGYQKWDYRGQNRPMAYARVMAAITDELEAMKQEGIWTPPEG